jgi:hypothetical protein
MSDTMQAPIGGELDQSSEGPGGNRRVLIALAALAGVLVIGAAVYFLFLSGGGSGDDELAAVPQTQATGTQDAKGNNGDGDKAGDKVPEEFKGNVGRDPFAPLAFELATAEPVATDPVATEPAATDAPAADPTGVPTTDPQPTSSSPATSAYAVEVKSVNVGSGRATIEVNDKVYTVKTGDVFPSDTTGPFKVLRLSKTDSGRGVAKVLFGSDLPVILKQGHPVTFGSF